MVHCDQKRRVAVKSVTGVVVSGVVLGAFLLGILHAGTSVGPAPLKVGTLDLTKVVEGFQKKKDLEAEINKLRDGAAAGLKDLQKNITTLSSELDLLDKNSAEYSAKKQVILEKQEELLMRTRLAEREVSEKLAQYLQEVYSEVLTKVSEYRDKNSFDLLLRSDTRPLTAQERIGEQLDRKLLLASVKSLDVTDDFVAFLNRSYTK